MSELASVAPPEDLKLDKRDEGEATSGFLFREDITDDLCQETELVRIGSLRARIQ